MANNIKRILILIDIAKRGKMDSRGRGNKDNTETQQQIQEFSGQDCRVASNNMMQVEKKRKNCGTIPENVQTQNFVTMSKKQRTTMAAEEDKTPFSALTEETTDADQELRYIHGYYADHSLDEDACSERQFAPAHRQPNFPEALYAIMANHDLSSIVRYVMCF